MKPPQHSYLDSDGHRHITLAIDVMTHHGDRFFCTFRYNAPMHFDFSLGRYVVDLAGFHEAPYDRYPSLRSREDLIIHFNDAKPVGGSKSATRQTTNHYDKIRNRTGNRTPHRHADHRLPARH